MRTLISLTFMLCCLGWGAPSKAQSYDKLWTQVNKNLRKDLPESVARSALSIYQKANREHNAPQMMKSYLVMTDARFRISKDSLKIDIEGLKRWAAEEKDSVNAAVLYSLLGEMCMEYDRTADWGDFFLRSVQPVESLSKRSAKDFVPMVKMGDASARYEQDRMYPVLARRALQLMKYQWGSDVKQMIDRICHNLQQYYLSHGQRESYVLVTVDSIKWQMDYPNSVKRYRKLIADYGDVETIVEAYYELCTSWRYHGNPLGAMKLADEAIARYPKYPGINQLKDLKKELSKPSLSFGLYDPYPGKEERMRVNYRNLTAFDLKIYRLTVDDKNKVWRYNPKDTYWKGKVKLYRTEHYTLLPTTDLRQRDTLLAITIPEEGYYLLEAIPVKPYSGRCETRKSLVRVHALSVIAGSRYNNRSLGMVVDRRSGKAVPGAKVQFYRYDNGTYNPIKDLLTADNDGIVRWDYDKGERFDQHLWMQAYTPEHQCMPIHNCGLFDRKEAEPKENLTLSLYRDRSAYRPGQTVYISGIAFTQKGDSLGVKSQLPVVLTLKDPNSKNIGKASVTTNEYGSFHASFALPTSCLNGYFLVEADGKTATGNVEFWVEEYKRPQFDVLFSPVEDFYKAGDTLRIKGTAKRYTGVPVQNALVKYSVTTGLYKRTEETRDSVRTDSAGQFCFPIVTDTLPYNQYWYQVEVISPDGETQTASSSINVYKERYWLELSGAPTCWIKEHRKQMRFTLLNYAGQQSSLSVRYELFKLEMNDSGKLVAGQRVLADSRMSGEPINVDDIYCLPSGNYRMRMWTDDIRKESKDSLDIKLLSLSDATVPECTDLFLHSELSADGKELVAYVGTSHKDISLLGLFYTGDGRVCGFGRPVSNQLIRLTSRFNEKLEYGDFIELECAFVKEGKLYRNSTAIEKPKPDKQLRLKWKTFRDKLTAGGKEEWRLQLLDKEGKPADAELMATLYDASLDKNYGSGPWRMPYRLCRNVPNLETRLFSGDGIYQRLDFEITNLSEESLALTTLLNPFRNIKYGLPKKRRIMGNEDVQVSMTGSAGLWTRSAQDRPIASEENTLNEKSVGLDSPADVTPRTNLTETAFFYPQLRTNAQGDVDIVFTLPESLTTWHLKGLAHNKEMDCVVLDTLAVASKEFMLQAVLPRFVRVGDAATLTATLSNLTNRVVAGTVRMELFDPSTEKVLHSSRQSFTLKSGNTLPVSFACKVTADYPVMACRMIAEGNGYSDGEQHLLPVLDKKEPVVEAVTVAMTKPGTLNADLSKLFNNQSVTATNRRLTVEFTGNPAWLAVLALPAVESPSDHNACSLSAAYYASLLSTWIVEHNPRIRTLMDAWKAQGLNAPEETLQSELRRNPELKELLLEASPFMEDADRETQQRRLCKQFDLNNLRNQQDLYVSKLKELQTDEGGWSWYKGMKANRYMTLSVMETLLRAKELTGVMDNTCIEMINKGFDYLDDIAVEVEKRMRKDKNSWWPDELISHYLYLNCLSQRTLSKDLQKTCDYFMARLKKTTGEMTIYGKAVAVQLFDNEDDASLRDDMVKTLLEYSVFAPEMGRYYDTFLARYTWSDYRIPTECMVIEALLKVGGHDKEVAQMRQWLLQQKRVQSWDTPLNTANAVYALLLDNASMLADKPMPTLQLDGKQIGKEPTLGLNSVKETLSIPSKRKAPRVFTVKKTDDGFSYGAVYARYTEDSDKLKPYSQGLSVRCDLYVERAAKSGVEWVKVTDGMVLKVGDKVKSLLTITADRDMDFVQVRENRASCMEPVAMHSGYRWGYYLAVKDVTMEYYMDKLPKGTHQYESLYYLTMSGTYEVGGVKVQSAYAPAFGAHTGGQVLKVQR